MKKWLLITLIAVLCVGTIAAAAGATELVSTNSGDHYNSARNVSLDGRYAVYGGFSGGSTYQKLFVRDRSAGTILSTGLYGSLPTISNDGRYVAYLYRPSATPTQITVAVFDRVYSQNSVIYSAITDADNPAISADGNIIGFTTANSTVVAGDTNAKRDVFVYNMTTGVKERVSISDTEQQANGDSYGCTISADGRYVTFVSSATNLVPGDTDATWDVYVRDRQSGTTELVSVKTSGIKGSGAKSNPSISDDGRYVVFDTAGSLVDADTNALSDIYLRDRQAGETTRISVSSSPANTQGNYASYRPVISGNGQYVVFYSQSSTFVTGDTNGYQDIFLRNLNTNQTTRISMCNSGNQVTGNCYTPSISSDGKYITYYTNSKYIVSDDIDSYNDVFLYQAF